MARFKRLEVYNTILETGLVPLFYNADIEVAKEVATACTDGGATVVEFIDSPPAEREASGSPPEGGSKLGKSLSSFF